MRDGPWALQKCVNPSLTRAVAQRSESSGQQQNKHDDRDHAQCTAGSIAPSAAVRPGGDGAYEHQNQNDQKNASILKHALILMDSRQWLVNVTTITLQLDNLHQRETTMNIRTTLAIVTAAILTLTATGCAVQRGQETVGAYVDDSAITTRVKARFIEDKQVDAAAISVETLNGTVMLSGFAKNANERSTAESIARGVKGVTNVRNQITIRP
eukprot:gene15010-17208_t